MTGDQNKKVTPDQIQRALAAGIAQIKPDPNGMSDAVCFINEHWFYFDIDDCGAGMTPEEYVAAKTPEQLHSLIAEAINGFNNDADYDEFQYYFSVLRNI